LDLSTFLLFLYGGHTYCRVLIPLKLKKRFVCFISDTQYENLAVRHLEKNVLGTLTQSPNLNNCLVTFKDSVHFL